MKERTIFAIEKKLVILTAVVYGGMLCSFRADAEAYSRFWHQDSQGKWCVQKPDGSIVKDAWLCDDAVAANGKDVWYLLDTDGNMLSAGLVQDGTGNFYSLETEHNGYYGMLRYRSGNYSGADLTFEENHNGSFAALLNADGIEALKAQYGVTSCAHINNSNIVYTSSFETGSGGNAPSSEAPAAAGGPNRIIPANGVRQGSYMITDSMWGSLMNMTPEEVRQDYWLSPNEKVYRYISNDNDENSTKRSKNNYGYAYYYNGENFVSGFPAPHLGNEAGEWVVDTSKPDAMYGKTNLRFRYPDGTYAGLGWHSCNMSEAYEKELKELDRSGDPMHKRYSYKWAQCFTEDGYMLRNTEVSCEFCWQGIPVKIGYDGSWLDGPQY